MKRLTGVLAVAVLTIAGCGADGEDPGDAAFEDVAINQCVNPPVRVPGIGVLGQKVTGTITELAVCVDVNVTADVAPEVAQYDDCGDPCYAVIVRDFDIKGDSKIDISYKVDGQPVTQAYDPEPVSQKVGNGRLCLVEVGGPPNPCSERITTPKSLTATSSKGRVALSWKRSIDTGNDNLLGYEIWRSEDGTTFGQLATLAETSFVDSAVEKGKQYWYYVVAFDAEGNRSQASNTAQGAPK
ncbi:MAG TPA: hypothetical protein VG929_11965 [Actinomycetota bacterium]|nr:hypothetical protein [Actinomycetota bacterium]